MAGNHDAGPIPGGPSAAGLNHGVRSDLLAFLAPPQAPGEIGRLGDHGVLEILGAGGMGVVFKARDPQLERLVALKVMLPSLASRDARERFLREARTAAAVKHDHVVTIHQIGEERGVPFLAMELLDGEPLDSRLRREGKLAVGEVLRIGRESAQALQAAHEQGLIHRDIKPANLFLEGRRGRVKVLDFGLARAVQQDKQLTQEGAIVGTPAYMSPEQAQAQPVDARTDLFSLGCVLYHASTGEQPFRGGDTVSTLLAVVTDQPRPPHQVNPVVPAALSELIMGLLSKKPADRPVSAAAVAEALQGIASDRTEQVAPVRPKQRERARGSRRLLRGAAGLGALAVAVGVALVILFHGGGSPRGNGNPGDPDNPDHRAAPGGATEPVSPVALVSRPAGLRPAVKGWTIETRLPRRPVRALAFHPSDGTLAAAGEDGAIRVYDSRTGELRRLILAEQRSGGLNEGVRALAWSPDGKTLASGGTDRIVRLWDVPSGGLVREFPPHNGAVSFLAFSPDGKVLAAGDDAGRVRFWGPGDGKKLDDIGPGVGPVRSLAWSAGRKWLAIGSGAAQHDDRKICVWAPGVGRYHFLRGGASPTWGTSPEDRWVLAYTDRDRVRFWDAEKRKPAGPEFKAHPNVWALAHSPAGKVLASAGADTYWGTGAAVRVWSSKRERLQNWGAAFAYTHEARTLTWSPDGKSVAYADLLALHLRDVDGKRALAIPLNGAGGQGGALSPDRKSLATLHGMLVKIWDLPGARWRQNLSSDWLWFRHVAWSSTDLVAGAGERGRPPLVVLALPSGRRVGKMDAATSYLSWSPDGAYLLAREVVGGGPVFGFVVHEAADFKKFEKPVRAPLAENGPVAWSPDSKSVAGRDPKKAELVRLWPLRGKEGPPLEGHKAPVRAVAFSKTDLLASGSNDSTIRLWDLKGARTFEPLKGHAGPVVGVSWAPGGATLASTGEDGTLRIWDINTGNGHILTKGSHPPGPWAWSADGKRIAAGLDGKIRVCDVESGKLLHEVAAGASLHFLAWADGDKALIAGRQDGRFDLWSSASGKLRCTLVNLRDKQWLAVSPEGHYDGPPDIERELVYVVQTESGQETLSPQQFADKYTWTNDLERLRGEP
jgi:WD40 repeat protein/serine/threonine protein kinase